MTGFEYWQAQTEKDPDAWLKAVMTAVGFSQEEIEGKIRERMFLEDEMLGRGRKFRETQKKRMARRDKELIKIGILAKQEYLRIMKRMGKTDEEIDQTLAALEDGGCHRGTV